LKAFLFSFSYAFKGVRVSILEQRNLKVQSALALITIAAGAYFKISASEWCMIILTIGLVLTLEMVNSSLENLVGMISKERVPSPDKVKDIAAGAVLVASVIALAVGVLVFKKYCYADYQVFGNLRGLK